MATAELKENNYILVRVEANLYGLGTWDEQKIEYRLGPLGSFQEINPLVYKLNEWHTWMMKGGV